MKEMTIILLSLVGQTELLGDIPLPTSQLTPQAVFLLSPPTTGVIALVLSNSSSLGGDFQSSFFFAKYFGAGPDTSYLHKFQD